MMPWESRTVEKQRKDFIEAAEKTANFSSLCREFGITRKTGYKWLVRSQENGDLTDQSRRPHTNPNRTPPEVEEKILRLRAENPGWGARKLKAVLEESGHTDIPCAKTVNNILNRYGCILPEESEKHKPYTRFEREKCNELWQADFKGDFLMNNGKRCFPLDIIDDHSRFLILISPTESTKDFVIPCFTRAFQEFGLPDAILCDNGPQFAGFRQGFTQFEKWLMNLDVLPIHEKIKHPQTQGKIERFHRTLKDELLRYVTFENIEDADRQLQAFREKYNQERPHNALGLRRPGELYVPSARPYTGVVKPYAYSGTFRVRKVNNWGYLRFDKFQVFLSQTMSNEYVEFRPNPLGDSFDICYRNYIIATCDPESGKILNRNIRRL